MARDPGLAEQVEQATRSGRTAARAIYEAFGIHRKLLGGAGEYMAARVAAAVDLLAGIPAAALLADGVGRPDRLGVDDRRRRGRGAAPGSRSSRGELLEADQVCLDGLGGAGRMAVQHPPLRPSARHGGASGSVLRSFGSSFVRLRVHRFGSRRSDRSVSRARSAAYSAAVRRSRPPLPGAWIGASLALPVEVWALVARPGGQRVVLPRSRLPRTAPLTA